MDSPFCPPPTVNNLDQTQRMRLVRSNRKLEAVLGTAPYYLEPECREMEIHAPTSKARRREGRVFGHSPSSSTSSLISEESYVVVHKSLKSSSSVTILATSTKSSKQTLQGVELSRPLLLRLRSVPVPSTDARTALLSPRLPSVTPLSPASPTFTIDLEKLQSTSLEKRRKKMAKLTRTLGENIPPELVFPSSSCPSSSVDPNATKNPTRLRNPQRKPLPSSFSPPTSAPLSPHNSAAKATVTTSQPKPKSRRPSVTVATAPPPPSSVSPHRSAKTPTLAERRCKPRPRSLSLSTGTDMFAAAAAAQLHAARKTEHQPSDVADILTGSNPFVRKAVTTTITIDQKATKDVLLLCSPPPFQTAIPDAAAGLEQHRHSRSSPFKVYAGHYHSQSVPSPLVVKSAAPSSFARFGKRKERGWSGEWNQDMREVAKVLRGLKAH